VLHSGHFYLPTVKAWPIHGEGFFDGSNCNAFSAAGSRALTMVKESAFFLTVAGSKIEASFDGVDQSDSA
jgi:hypothetical protein